MVRRIAIFLLLIPLCACEELTEVTLNWHAPEEGCFLNCSYKVYRGICDTGVLTHLTTTEGFSYTDKKARRGSCYTYGVSACNLSGCSEPSSLSITVPKVKGPLIYKEFDPPLVDQPTNEIPIPSKVG